MVNTDAAKMAERYCALSIGIIFFLVGFAGFIPALVSLPGSSESYVPLSESHSAYAAGFGFIFGLFPTNFLHNIVRCGVGLWGVASFNNASSARIFNRSFAIAYVVLAIMGLIPLAKTFFGFMPLFGNNVWFNALAAIAALYYGIIIPAKVEGVSVAQRS
jgi:hypothetical protein